MTDYLNRLSRIYHLLKTQTFYKLAFREIGERSVIIRPSLIINPQHVRIKNRVQIRHDARIETVIGRHGSAFNPEVEIGDETAIEQGLHLVCAERITIGKKVAIAEYVGIFDIWHTYQDPALAIMDQPLKTAPIRIGD